MRKFLTLTLVAGFLLFSSAAQAATLTSATWVGNFQGTAFTLTTAGASLLASGSSTSAAGHHADVVITAIAPLFTVLTTTGLVPVFISQTLGGSQTISISGQSVSPVANQGINGLVNVFIGLDSGGLLLFTVQLGVGVAGSFQTTAIVPGLQLPVEVTATFSPWTTKNQTVTGIFGTTVTVGGLTNMTVTAPDFMTTGSWNLTSTSGAGTITLVSATRTRICVGAGFTGFPCNGVQQSSISGTATRLTLNFAHIPEPGTLLLLGAGLLGLAAVGRRQRS